MSQTVMNSLGGQEDTSESEYLTESKHEIRVKQETEAKPNLMELFDINYRLKLEPKLFKDVGCVAEEKPVIKSEESGMDGDLKPSRLSFTKSENSLGLPQQTNETSPHVAAKDGSVLAKADVPMSADTNFSALCSGLPRSMCSTPSSASAAAALSSFRSIDSILQPDLKTKSTAGLFVSLAGNMSSPAPYFASPSTHTTEAAQWNLNRSIQNGTWFSILPRVPCDASTLKPPLPLTTSCPPPPAGPPLTPDLSRANTPRPSFGCCTPSSSVATSSALTPIKSELFGDDLLMISGDLDMQSEYAVPQQDAPPIPSGKRIVPSHRFVAW